MNYTQLVAAIEAYTENQFSKADVDTFIKQAEHRIYNAVQFPSLRRNVTGHAIAGNQYLACPNDFLSSYSFAVINPTTGAYTYMLNKDVSFIREMYANPSTTGTPRYFALWGPRYVNNNELVFIFGPTPDVAYDLELHYYFYPQSICDTENGDSWLGDNFDTVLLYGSLVEAYTFMKGEPELMANYQARYKDALEQAKRLGDGLERQDGFRNQQVRLPVV